MPSKRTDLSEKRLEDIVVATLTSGPMYRERPRTAFDAQTLLDAAELAAFIQATQPKEWAKLSKQFSGQEQETLAGHVTALVHKRGTLEVLRSGASFNGINLQLAFFRPSAGGNPEHQAQYAGNRFAVMRQVHFSAKAPDQSADVLVLLNGLPIVSVELKNHFTGQNVQHAIAQYCQRDAREPFWKRCLVHFAVDDDAAYMTTRVAGPDTAFLPFNRDTQNPVIPERFASSYLWDDFTDEDGEQQTGILRADSLLLLIQNYLHYERDEKTGKEKLKLIVAKLNQDYGIAFEEADRVVNAIKQKLEADEALRAAFQTNSIEFLRRQKLQDSIRDAFLSNADEFLSFMSKTETDPGFGKFFFSEMFKWYEQAVSAKPAPAPGA